MVLCNSLGGDEKRGEKQLEEKRGVCNLEHVNFGTSEDIKLEIASWL